VNLARLIAWRYLRRPTEALVSAVGLVSIFGLVIGVMALVISMALMTGYRGDLQRKLLGGNAEVYLYSVGGPIADTASVLKVLQGTPGVAEASPVVFKIALVTTEANATGAEVTLKGIDPARAKTSPMLAKVVGPTGALRGVALGKYMAKRLGVTQGSSISVTVPSDREGSFMPQSSSFVVTNVFDTGFYEYDARWLFVDLREAERLTGTAGTANLIEVKLTPGASIEDTISAIDNRTKHHYAISDWRDLNKQLFAMLWLQQKVLFIVIGLIVFVSTFNIVSTLIMTVHEKRKEIGILTSMGAERNAIASIFIWYGSMVGFAGTATGIALGTSICWVMTRFKLLSFPPEIAEVYYVSSIPFVTRGLDLLVIAGFSLLVSFTATIVPSLRAAKLTPVEALRHE